MTRTSLRQEIPRTFFHVLGGVFLGLTGLLLPRPLDLVVLGSIFAAALLVDLARLRSPAVGRLVGAWMGSYMRPAEAARLTGAPAFTGGVFLSFLLFSENVAAAALVPLVFGDRAGLLVGKACGRVHFWGKTLEGSLGCFAASFLSYLLLAAGFPGIFTFPAPVLAVAAGLGTVAEALPRPSDDNLVIPLAVGVFLSLVTP